MTSSSVVCFSCRCSPCCSIKRCLAPSTARLYKGKASSNAFAANLPLAARRRVLGSGAEDDSSACSIMMTGGGGVPVCGCRSSSSATRPQCPAPHSPNIPTLAKPYGKLVRKISLEEISSLLSRKRFSLSPLTDLAYDDNHTPKKTRTSPRRIAIAICQSSPTAQHCIASLPSPPTVPNQRVNQLCPKPTLPIPH